MTMTRRGFLASAIAACAVIVAAPIDIAVPMEIPEGPAPDPMAGALTEKMMQDAYDMIRREPLGGTPDIMYCSQRTYDALRGLIE
jgi:hypothetical protein